MSFDNPFWFASEGLLTEVLRDEISLVTQLFAKHPDLREFFDLPEAPAPQRAACFAVLAHRTLMETIYETFAGRYMQSPSLGDEERDVLRRMQNLFAGDAPAWVLEVNEVAELLPSRVYEALPEPLRKGGRGFDSNNPTQVEAITAAREALRGVEQIRGLTTKVINEQLQRLERRWSASISAVSQSQPVQQAGAASVTLGGQTRRMNKRQGWEQKLKLYGAIRTALDRNSSLEGIEFCAELDTRHAPPLYDWVKTGQWREGLTWKEAWGDPRLRKKIRRVRQEAMKTR